MAVFSFRNYPYIPTLSAMDAELRGYKELAPADKKAILSVWTAGKLGQAQDVHQAAGKIAAAVGGVPFVLRLDERARQPGAKATKKTIEAHKKYNAFTAAMLDPTDGYANWRGFVSGYDDAIPCLPYPEDAVQYVAAAKSVIDNGSPLAFWVDMTGHAPNLVPLIAALKSVSSTDQCLVIVDFGKIVDTIGAGASFKEIRQSLEQGIGGQKFGALTFVATGTSFDPPPSTGLWARKIRELELFDACGGYDATQYGDYGSVARNVGGGRWVGRIDYAKPATWIMWRGKDPSNSADYVTGCKKIRDSGHMDKGFVTWGTDEILRQAGSKVVLDGNGGPAHWISVRVNIHVIRQLRRAALEFSRFQIGDATPPERPIKADPVLLKLDE